MEGMKGVNYKDVSTPRHAWLFIASSDNWQGIVKRGSFGVKPDSPSIKEAKEARPGELCVAFVTKKKLFAGLGKITGSYYNDKASEFPHRVQLQVRLDIGNAVPAETIVNDLQFITNKTKWWSHLQRALRRIPLSDYKVIREALEFPPTSIRLQPLMQEGREKVTRNGGIESHAEAETDLLELGNFLGFDTYVTADDRNKEFRGKLLSEIATLRELPEDFIPPGVKDTVHHIDVIWFEKKLPKYCIEVEHSTDITHGLLRLYRLKELKTSFMVVAPTGARDKFKREVKKAPFDSIRDSFRFKSYDELAKFPVIVFSKTLAKDFGYAIHSDWQLNCSVSDAFWYPGPVACHATQEYHLFYTKKASRLQNVESAVNINHIGG